MGTTIIRRDGTIVEDKKPDIKPQSPPDISDLFPEPGLEIVPVDREQLPEIGRRGYIPLTPREIERILRKDPDYREPREDDSLLNPTYLN